MSKFDINDPLGLSELTAKTCVICQFNDHQEEIVETPEGFCHRECLDDNIAKHREEVSEENNEHLL